MMGENHETDEKDASQNSAKLPQNDIKDFTCKTWDLASPAIDFQAYLQADLAFSKDKHLEMMTQIEEFTSLKRSSKAGSKLISNQVYQQKVRKIMSKLLAAFETLRADNEPGLIELISLFSNQIEVKIKDIGTFSICDDLQSQVIIVESPLSGAFCFEITNGKWLEIKKEYQIEGFLKGEIDQFVEGFLSC